MGFRYILNILSLESFVMMFNILGIGPTVDVCKCPRSSTGMVLDGKSGMFCYNFHKWHYSN